MVYSSLSALKKQKEAELAYQKLLIEQLIQKQAEEKIFLMGKFDPSVRDDFTLVPIETTTNGSKMYLKKETLDAFVRMATAAEKDEIELKIASATRNFDYQKNIWNNKWTGFTLVDGKDLSKSTPDEFLRFEKILEYSAVPGASRHHWGTDIDINDANPQYFEKESGEKVYAWLTKNAWMYGFCQPYNLKGSARPTGYNEEKWHWSYFPLAKNFTQEYKNLITDKDINGFLGDEYATKLGLVNNYALSINPECI